jgi:DNA-binding XRE family transcriptional regulator
MPRSPSHYSIVREIRKRVGWTQAQLAERIGTSWISISRVENGSLKISRKLALRLTWETGVPYRDIMNNKVGPPQTQRDGELDLTKISNMDIHARRLTFEQIQKSLVDNATYRAELLYRAAHATAPRKIWSLDAAIMIAFEELAEEFGLTNEVAKLEPLRGKDLRPAAKSAKKRAPQAV